MTRFNSPFRLLAAALPFCGVLAIGRSDGQPSVLAQIGDLSPHELRTEAFAIDRSAVLRIHATGADEGRRWRFRRDWFDSGRNYWRGNAWILDAHTREVVWELRVARTQGDDDGIRTFDGEVTLPPGEYIVHYASYSAHRSEGDWNGRWERETRRYYDDGLSEEFGIEINGEGRSLGEEALRNATNYFNQTAIVSFIGLEDEESHRVGFRVSRPTEIEIYAIGEAIDETTYDYGWLINLATREKVWRFDYGNTDWAGGAEKNRMASTTLTLEPGSYAAFFVTDGSHDLYDWNAAPPYDPEFWGLTIRATDPADRQYFATFTYESVPRENVIVELVGLRDDETVARSFTLTRPIEVNVFAIGEGQSGDMFDYGWIMDARTREIVWRMDYYDTDHAGGAAKNRVIDEVIRLDSGSYTAYFVTDGSHSYWEWNSSPPIEGELWGITLSGVGDGFDMSAVTAYEPASDPAIVAQLVEIRDHERRRTRFTLDQDTEVRIYALGEGIGNDMYDFGWIEEVGSGRVVWEMTYRSTERAGGARKNRLFNGTMSLSSGDYILRYESDGSHSFGDWNADPPPDPAGWGVTIYRVGS
ncbi:MAG: hypothetical protein V3R24_05425 [Gemmatimonadales bacterium]